MTALSPVRLQRGPTSAGDMQYLPGDIAGLFAGQEKDGLCYLVRPAQPFEGATAFESFDQLRIQSAHYRRVDQSGRHAIYIDRWRQFHRQAAGKRRNRGLGRSVVALSSLTGISD